MKRGWVINAVLVIAVAALIATVIYRPGAQEEPSWPIATLAPDKVTHLRIEPKGSEAIELEKQGESWHLKRPLQARADRGPVAQILDLLAARSKEKLAATDLQRFDLDPPALKVTFNDFPVAFGGVNPLTQDQYVLASGTVYLLPSRYRSMIPDRPDRLLTHSLFREDEKPVAFALEAVKVEQKDGKWTTAPAPAGEKERPSQDDFVHWVDDWRLASSLLTQPASSKTPSGWIEVRLADGRTVRLGVLQKEPDLVLVREDEKLTFYFSEETRKRLLQPPKGTPPAEPGPAANSAVKPQ